jgi:DNA-directed RNA polymerase subunit RPC12/RpoP
MSLPDVKPIHATGEPTCPYCHHKHRADAEGWNDTDFYECDNCGKMFNVDTYVDVSFNTAPAALCEHCNRWQRIRTGGVMQLHYRRHEECPGSKQPAKPQASAEGAADAV